LLIAGVCQEWLESIMIIYANWFLLKIPRVSFTLMSRPFRWETNQKFKGSYTCGWLVFLTNKHSFVPKSIGEYTTPSDNSKGIGNQNQISKSTQSYGSSGYNKFWNQSDPSEAFITTKLELQIRFDWVFTWEIMNKCNIPHAP
jgi:hypothetical protein